MDPITIIATAAVVNAVVNHYEANRSYDEVIALSESDADADEVGKYIRTARNRQVLLTGGISWVCIAIMWYYIGFWAAVGLTTLSGGIGMAYAALSGKNIFSKKYFKAAADLGARSVGLQFNFEMFSHNEAAPSVH